MSAAGAEIGQAGGAGRLTVLAVALGVMTLWAGTPIATKLAVGGVDGTTVGILRTMLAGTAALPIILLARPKLPSATAGRGALLITAIIGFVAFPLLFSLGVARTSAGHAALLLALLPIFTGLIAGCVERRLPGLGWWLGAAIAVGGTILLVSERFGLGASGATLQGDLLVIAGAFCASVGYVMGAKASRGVGSWSVTLWALLLASAVLLPLAALTLPFDRLARADVELWSALLYLSVLSSIVGYAAWYWALAQGNIGQIGMIQFTQPLISLLLAVLILGESLTWPLLLAAGVIVAGVALAQRRPTR